MQRKALFPLLIAAMMVMIYSCGRSDKSGIAVPKDASVVVHINAPSLSKKLPWDEIRQTNWFKEAYAEAKDTLAKQMLDDPQKSGINVEADLVFFAKKQSKGGYMVFEGMLKDPAAFEAFNKKMNDSAATSKDGDLTIMRIKNNSVITWSATRFVYVINAPNMNFSSVAGFGRGNSTLSEPYVFPADSLQKFGKELFNLSADNSMYKDARFAALMKESGDIHFWLNNEQTYNTLDEGMLSMLKVNILFDRNATGITLNFDNGKIVMKSKQFFNDELLKLMKKHEAKGVASDLLNRIPSQNVCAAFVMNYKPEGLKEFIKLIGVDGMANGFLEKVDYSVDEFIKANKGDLIFSVSDFQIKTQTMTMPNPDGGEPYTHKSEQPDLKVLFATSVNDRAAFDKMIGVVRKEVGEIPEGNGIPKISYKLDKDWFAIGNDQEQVNKFLAGGSNSNNPYASKISGHPFGGFIDLQKIMTAFGTSVTDTTGKASLDASIKMWQDIIMTGGAIKDDAMDYNVEINLVDKNTNSLKQLNQYLDKMSVINKSKRNYAPTDATTLAPAEQ